MILSGDAIRLMMAIMKRLRAEIAEERLKRNRLYVIKGIEAEYQVLYDLLYKPLTAEIDP